MQQQLFAVEEIQVKTQGLVISRSGKQSLTQNQQAFNKLTQKIERLHKEVKDRQVQFDRALSIYGKEVYPVKNRLVEYKRRLVTILWDHYKSKMLSKPDQRHLKSILSDNVQELIGHMDGEPDEALKKMFTELAGESFDKLQEREKKLMKLNIEELFDDLGLDRDGMDMNDEKAVLEKIAECEQKLKEEQGYRRQQQQRKKKKKKTPKQEETEQLRISVEELKQKNISTIYKQLAKLFHPDLEQDEQLRAGKEVLMKELTAAYEAKNLHALLTLELKWIHKENDHLETLTDEKLFIYLAILREQARELEQEIHGIYLQPRYQVLVEEFGPRVQRIPVETVKEHLQSLRKIENTFKSDLENFQSPHFIRYIKAMIKEWKAIERQDKYSEEAELMEMLFRQHF